MKLKSKILIPITLLIAASIIISTIISYTSVKKTIFNLSKEQLNAKVNSAQMRLNDRIEAIISEAEKLSQYKDVQKATKYKGLRSKVSKFFSEYITNRTYFEELILTDTGGKAIASNIEKTVNTLDVSRENYFELTRKGKISVSCVQKSLISGNPVFIIGVPVYMNKKIEGLILAVVDLKTIGDKYIKPLKVGKTGYGYLMSEKGLVICHPDKKKILSFDMASFDFVKKIIMKKTGFIEYIQAGNDMIVSFAPVKSTKWILALGVDLDELIAPAKAMRTILIIIGVLSIVILGAGIFVFIQTMVVKPVNEIGKSLKDIAKGEGDLTKRLDIISKDEIGELSIWFNSFIEKLESIIVDIKSNVIIVSSSSRNLSTLSSNMAKSAEDMTGKAKNLNQAADGMSLNMNSVAAAVEQATTNINMVSSAAEQLNGSITQIAENSDQGRNVTTNAVLKTQDASTKIDKLGKATKEISRVTQVIAEISEQTNLLALNATIEAARAGEAGKGFAVVASEIKDLAFQTAKATEDIKTSVQAIQTSTHESVEEIQAVSNVIEDVNQIVSNIADAVEQQSLTTGEIAENIIQASSGLSEINENIALTSQSAANIAEDVTQVAGSASDFSNISSEVDSNSKELSGLSKNLNNSIGGFKVSEKRSE